MILETIRLVANALATGSYGVNTQLSSLTLDVGDTVPPSLVTVVDETRNDEVAVGRYPETYPCLVVTLDGSVELQGEVTSNYRDAEVTVMVRYVQSNIETAQARTDCYYTLRAVQKCLKTFFSNLQAADRSKNNVQVIECLSFEHVPMFENINDTMVTSGIRIKMFVRDITP